ncbi:hypothetical protein [Streptomyces atratus]|uniref:hypothetical protein n=1 Tax=Streptomyces atratus TaxID=1893 RepID=UPI00324E0157
MAPDDPLPRSRHECHFAPEQGINLAATKELLGHAHIGVTIGAYAHVRLRLQRDAIDTLSTALGSLEITETTYGDGDEPPACAALVR